MTDMKEQGDCPKICWGLAALAALLTFVLLMAVGDWRFLGALLVAVLLLVGLGLLLKHFLCGSLGGRLAQSGQGTSAKRVATENPAAAGMAAGAAAVGGAGAAVAAGADAGDADRRDPEPATPTGSVAESTPVAAAEPVEEPAPIIEDTPEPAAVSTGAIEVPEDAGPRVLPSTPLAGEAELASRKGTWTYTAPEATEAPKAPAAPLGEDYDGDGILEGKDEGEKPALLDGPREGVADDLKQIKGIGPKLEALCNRLGIYHFDQIGAWTDQEIAWVDANLEGFKGRVSRDQWVAQARVLAEGGQTEFSARVQDGGVY